MPNESSYKMSLSYTEEALSKKLSRRLSRSYTTTRSNIVSLYSKDDKTALQKEYKKLASAANRRLSEFDKLGISSSATRYIRTVIEQYREGRNKFGTTKRYIDQLSASDLKNLAIDINSFLHKQGSYVEGEYLAQKRREATFIERFEGFAAMDTERRDEFLTFLGDTSVQAILEKSGKGSIVSKQVVEYIRGIYETGDDQLFKELVDMMEQYEQGRLFIDQVWDRIGL